MKTQPTRRWFKLINLLLAALSVSPFTLRAEEGVLDFRYAPPDWQTSICLPDDPQKTLVSKEGALLYDYPGKFSGFATRIAISLEGDSTWEDQRSVAPRVPIVRTTRSSGPVKVLIEAFAVTPTARQAAVESGGRPLAVPPDSNAASSRSTPPLGRQDLLVAHFRNVSSMPTEVHPVVILDTAARIVLDPGKHRAQLGQQTALFSPMAWERVTSKTEGMVLHLPAKPLAPGKELTLALGICRREGGMAPPVSVGEAIRARDEARRYWQRLDLPYGRIQVPDPAVQGLLDSCVRNIYQAREIKQGLPAFQVGPTCYRGLWVVDGSFLLEAMTYLGRTNDTRNGVKYLLSFQRPDGSFMLIDGHWKETGIALWAITRHARLTGDLLWLRQVWPKVERGFEFIGKLRATPPADAPNAGLIPDGFSDGGLADKVPEYTNIYWTLAGMKAAIAAARWLGENSEADRWQREYDDFYATFRRAAGRDTRTDAAGNRYVPTRMRLGEGIPPQKGQWAFLHAIFPGRVFAAGDPLVEGNLAMLRAVEEQGLVRDTGWLKDGIWTYFGSFYAHAWLWTGHGDKAAQTLYAFGNHASPLLAWREEQMPVGHGRSVVGDMPHNWASAEFIRLVRHALVLERGDELHLLEALPASWTKPGSRVRLQGVLTEFGPITMQLDVPKNGRAAVLTLEPPSRTPPRRILVHRGEWSPTGGTMELSTTGRSQAQIPLSGR